jgi:hypothetical protein
VGLFIIITLNETSAAERVIKLSLNLIKVCLGYYLLNTFTFIDILPSINTYYIDDVYTLLSPLFNWNRSYRKRVNKGPKYIWYDSLNSVHKELVDSIEKDWTSNVKVNEDRTLEDMLTEEALRSGARI